jgi:hypothetical protein
MTEYKHPPRGLKFKLAGITPTQYAHNGASLDQGYYRFVSEQAPDGRFYHYVISRPDFWKRNMYTAGTYGHDDMAYVRRRLWFDEVTMKAWGYAPRAEPEVDDEPEIRYCECSYCEGHRYD